MYPVGVVAYGPEPQRILREVRLVDVDPADLPLAELGQDLGSIPAVVPELDEDRQALERGGGAEEPAQGVLVDGGVVPDALEAVGKLQDGGAEAAGLVQHVQALTGGGHVLACPALARGDELLGDLRSEDHARPVGDALDPAAGLGGGGGAVVGPVDLEEREIEREVLELVEAAARALRVNGAVPVLVVPARDTGLEHGRVLHDGPGPRSFRQRVWTPGGPRAPPASGPAGAPRGRRVAGRRASRGRGRTRGLPRRRRPASGARR